MATATTAEPRAPAPLYRWLIGHADPAAGDGFDRHVVASILTIALQQWRAGERDHADWLGLEPALLDELAQTMFPRLRRQLLSIPSAEVSRSADEACLYQLLWRHASPRGLLQRALAAMIARRALRPNHLWEDLGLKDRAELSRLLWRHFAPLAERNNHNLRWKKFFYRQICSDAEFALCSSPVCCECDDYAGCFDSAEFGADEAATGG